MNYKEVYEEGMTALLLADIDDAKLDARLLLEHICGTDRNTLLAHPEKEISLSEYERYKELLERRISHVPLQYIIGLQEFMGLSFQVNHQVLIPRQDTELLVEEVLLYLHDGMSVLDMCTGSGCILLSLLHYSNGCSGVGADISQEALELAGKNAEILKLQPMLRRSDLFEQITGNFDIIVSNPPYIETAVIERLMEEVKDHEPRLALDGKEDGLYFYRNIIEGAKPHLNGGGWLFFEIGYTQAEAVCAMMIKGDYREITVKKDYAGLDRIVFGRKGNAQGQMVDKDV